MSNSDAFVSVVAPCSNCAEQIVPALEKIVTVLGGHYSYYELIIVDDASRDETSQRAATLLTKYEGLRLFRMATAHGVHICVSAGLDSAIGDYVVVMDPLLDPAEMIPEIVRKCSATGGVHYGVIENKHAWRPLYGVLSALFAWYCKRYLRIDIQRGSASFRVFSRAAINNLVQTRDRSRIMRVLTANAGLELHPFAYQPARSTNRPSGTDEGLFDQINVAFEVLVSSSRHPLRWLSRLGLAASFLNLLYICYIVGIYLFKSTVAEGWITLSMQNAGMFFLLFCLLTVLCEYIGKLHMESQQRPLYSIAEERNSTVLIDSGKRRNIVSESRGVQI
jgi:glycosyltransferase involved in cell wall biosynthesis